jgi:glycosyltransferase involved in cell wall biosynthesis
VARWPAVRLLGPATFGAHSCARVASSLSARPPRAASATTAKRKEGCVAEVLDHGMAQPLRLSVALVTRNRIDSLRRTLRSLGLQRPQPFEVIVSDDSDDAGAPSVQAVVEEFGYIYVRGPRRGLYANRNHAIAHCRGTHVRTMDDDHEFPKGHFAACLAAIEKDPASVWIIGEFVGGEIEGRGLPVCPGQLTPRGFSVTPPDPQRCWAIADGATIYPRCIFDAGVLFSESFEFGAPYLEFGARLYNYRYRIRFLASTYLLHHYDPRSRSYLDIEIAVGSRTFATLCYSFIYQPSLRNQAWTLAELIRTFVRTGCRTRPFLRAAKSFRQRLLSHREYIVGRQMGSGTSKP